MRIAIGCDEAAYALKVEIMKHLETKGIAYKDFGAAQGEVVLYPDVAYTVADAVAAGEFERGILVCGTGIGMSLAANKVRGIRAAACSDHFSAKYTRLHNDANILCLGGRVVGIGTALELCDLFVDTPFEGGRHQRRVDMITALERE